VHDKVDTSKPLPPVTLTDEDKALIAKHGVEGLAAMGYHGLLDRYHRSRPATAPAAKAAVFPKKKKAPTLSDQIMAENQRAAKDAEPINSAAPAGKMAASKLALEVWRASGKRTLSRLDSLVEHYATTLGEGANKHIFKADARRAVRDWELEDE
jgi:hypothetical protein